MGLLTDKPHENRRKKLCLSAKFGQKSLNFCLCLSPVQTLHHIPCGLLIFADIMGSRPGHPPVSGADGESVNLVHVKIPAVHAGGVGNRGMIAQKRLQVAISHGYQTGRTSNNGLSSSFNFHNNYLQYKKVME